MRANFWHYVPVEFKRTDDVTRFAPALAQALDAWFNAAMAGELMNKAFSFVGSEGTVTRPKTEDDKRCDAAGALLRAREWDGYLLAEEFDRRGWPADADLVQRCHRWSCDLEKARREEWKAKKAREGK